MLTTGKDKREATAVEGSHLATVGQSLLSRGQDECSWLALWFTQRIDQIIEIKHLRGADYGSRDLAAAIWQAAFHPNVILAFVVDRAVFKCQSGLPSECPTTDRFLTAAAREEIGNAVDRLRADRESGAVTPQSITLAALSRTFDQRYSEYSDLSWTKSERDFLVEEAWHLHKLAQDRFPKTPEAFGGFLEDLLEQYKRFRAPQVTPLIFLTGIAAAALSSMDEQESGAEAYDTIVRMFGEATTQGLRRATRAFQVISSVIIGHLQGHPPLERFSLSSFSNATVNYRYERVLEAALDPRLQQRIFDDPQQNPQQNPQQYNALIHDDALIRALRTFMARVCPPHEVDLSTGEGDLYPDFGTLVSDVVRDEHSKSKPSGSLNNSCQTLPSESWLQSVATIENGEDIERLADPNYLRSLSRSWDALVVVAKVLTQHTNNFSPADIKKIASAVTMFLEELRGAHERAVREKRENRKERKRSEALSLKDAQADSTQNAAHAAREAAKEARNEYYSSYQPAAVTGRSDAALTGMCNYTPSPAKQAVLDEVKGGVTSLRESFLDRRGVLDSDAPKKGDPFIDQFANLLFEPTNIGAVLKACDFDDLSKFRSSISISSKTPDRSNLNALGDLYRQSESVRACLAKILTSDDKNVILFVGALTLDVHTLKALRVATSEQLQTFKERIRGVVSGAERVASVKTKRVSDGSSSVTTDHSSEIPAGFWGQIAGDEEDWDKRYNGDGSITLIRIEDGVSLTIPMKKLKILDESVAYFRKNFNKAESQRELDLMLQRLESEGYSVTRQDQQTRVAHVGADVDVTIDNSSPREGIGRIQKLVAGCESYRAELDALYNHARESGVDLTLVTDDSGCSAVVSEDQIRMNGIYPTRQEMQTIRTKIEEAKVRQSEARTAQVRIEALRNRAERLLPNHDTPSIILDATVLIDFSASFRGTPLLKLLKLVSESGVRLYVPATVFFECTGMVPSIRDGERQMELVLLFALSDHRSALFTSAPMISVAQNGSGVGVVGCANLSEEGNPNVIIVEGPYDRDHFRNVRKEKGVYLRNDTVGGSLADHLRSVHLLGEGAGDRSIREFYTDMRKRIEERGNTPKILICSDDFGLQSQDEITFGARDLISYLYVLSTPDQIGSLLGSKDAIYENDLVDTIAAASHRRLPRRMHWRLQERRAGQKTIKQIFESEQSTRIN
ncbi:MAG: hypothetical protein RIS36_677 [Pseudomonadota bacterium]|jgi:hypothetical protein